MNWPNLKPCPGKLQKSSPCCWLLLLRTWQKNSGENLGHNNTLAYEPFPEYDEKVLQVSEVEILVQVLGRPKARLMMPVDCDADTAKAIALADETVKAALNGKEPKKVIYVQGRLLNIVI